MFTERCAPIPLSTGRWYTVGAGKLGFLNVASKVLINLSLVCASFVSFLLLQELRQREGIQLVGAGFYESIHEVFWNNKAAVQKRAYAD